MKVININSNYLLTSAQESFTESVILCGEEESVKGNDSISILMNEIPVFLINDSSMPELEKLQKEIRGGDKKVTEYLGFYAETKLDFGDEIPAIYLCPERIMKEVETEEELLFLIANVTIHEFAHAKMRKHPNSNYGKTDKFYLWIEEPMANLITLQYFDKYQRFLDQMVQKKSGQFFMSKIKTKNAFEFVQNFISNQPANYKLGNDLFEHGVSDWYKWRNDKYKLGEDSYKKYEKQIWLDYTTKNADYEAYILIELYDALFNDIS